MSTSEEKSLKLLISDDGNAVNNKAALCENDLDTREENEDKEETKLEKEEDESLKKTLLMRYFSPIRDGSLRSSIFSISSVCLGMGTLAIPSVLDKVSFLFGTLFLCCSGGIGYWSLNILTSTSRKLGTHTYSETVRKSFGPGFSLCLDISIVLYIYGAIIGYIIVSIHLIGLTYFELFVEDGTITASDWEKDVWSKPLISYLVSFGCSLLVLPLCLLRDISKMTIANLFSIITLIYVILVVVFESPFYFSNFLKNNKDNKINWFDLSKGFNSNFDFFKGLATFFFAFSCQTAAIPVYKTLNNNSARRVKKVFRRSIILDTTIYLATAITGFLTVPIDTPPIIIYRKTIGGKDFAMIIARLGMAISLLLSIPCNYNGLRISVFEMVFKTSEISTGRNWLLTIPVLGSATLLAINFTEIDKYFSILGGFLAVIISFVFPALVYIKTNDLPLTNWRNLGSIVILFLVTAIGFTSGTKTLIELFTGGTDGK